MISILIFISFNFIFMQGAVAQSYTRYFHYGASRDGLATVEMTDPGAHLSTYSYRAYGNPSQKQLMRIELANGNTTNIERSANGLIQQVKQGNYTRQYDYDVHHYLVKVTEPETGTTVLTRDALGRILSKKIGDAKPISYQYDALSHLLSIDYHDPEKTPNIDKKYDSLGQLTEITNGDTQWHYEYDASGNQLSAQLQAENRHYKIKYHYDELNHLSAMTYPDGIEMRFSPYANSGMRSQVGAILKDIHYFANGAVKSYQTASGLKTQYTVNDRQLINSMQVTNANQEIILQREYAFDENKNLTEIHADRADQDISLSYDAAAWLIAANGPWGEGRIEYDMTGNITQKKMGKWQYNYAYDVNNHRLEAISGLDTMQFEYDAIGNMISNGEQDFVFNAASQLIESVGSYENKDYANLYHYDAEGHRFLSIDSKGKTNIDVYDKASHLLHRENMAKQKAKDFIYLKGHAIAEIEHPIENSGQQEVHYFHPDLLGSPILSTDEEGKIMNRYSYLPFGYPFKNQNDLSYTGKPFDVESGLIYSGNRYYNPLLGRFMSVDPIGFTPKNPMSFNRYAYGNNNPYHYVDPDGCYALDYSFGQFTYDLSRGIQNGMSVGTMPANRVSSRFVYYSSSMAGFGLTAAAYETGIPEAAFLLQGMRSEGAMYSRMIATKLIGKAVRGESFKKLSNAAKEAVSLTAKSSYVNAASEIASALLSNDAIRNRLNNTINGGLLFNPKSNMGLNLNVDNEGFSLEFRAPNGHSVNLNAVTKEIVGLLNQ